MIPQPKVWKVTFYMHDGGVRATTVLCVKRFAKSAANAALGYPAYDAEKITVGLVRNFRPSL